MFEITFKSYPILISTITPRMGPCLCKGVCSSSTCTSPKHTYSPIWKDHGSLSPSPCTFWSGSPPFCWWFSSWNKGYFILKNIYLSFGLFTTFFSSGPLGMVYELLGHCFVPEDSTKWLWLLFRNMWAHCLRSCSPFNVIFVFCILIFNIRETI